MRSRLLAQLCSLAACALLAACSGDETASSVTGEPDTATDTAADPSPDGSADAAPSCPDSCRDGDPCTLDSCNTADGTCAHEPLEVCCPDDHCQIAGACVPNQAGNPDNSCQTCQVAVDAEAWTADNRATCDDGDACTEADRCEAGRCVGDARICADEDPCTIDACDAETGACTTAPNEGGYCDDDSACTRQDRCTAGTCAGTEGPACDDQNPCTADSCDRAQGCVAIPVADGTACADSLACTTAEVCQAGQCVTERNSCDDSNLCTADFCSGGSGAGAGCGHRDLTPLCGDSNPCTDETCDPTQGCVYPFNTNSCDDSDLCTIVDTCTSGACLGTPLDPSDGNPCTDDRCERAVGPTYANNTLSCDDNDLCTVGDLCADGGCISGTEPLNCEDGNVCTTGQCDPALGCLQTNNTESCNDNTVCTIADTCADGSCAGTPISCDDGRACTIDSCDPVDGCKHELIQSAACRPSIEVVTPLRAETILGTTLPPAIAVRGRLISPAGPITSFTINGQPVSLAYIPGTNWNYSFRINNYAAQVGPNTLVFEATDDLGTTKKRVQAFHWSTQYTNPNAAVAGSGMVTPGLGVWLGQQTLDDGRGAPPTDIAAIFQTVLRNFDTAALFDPSRPLTSQQGYDIYLRSITIGGSTASIQATDTGLRLVASLLNLRGRLYFDCTGGFFSVCGIAGGDGGGSLSVSSITVTANINISVRPDNTLAVTLANSSTSLNGLSLSADNGWTNFLLSIILPFVRDQLVGSFEGTINNQLSGVIGPLLESALSALAFNLAFDLPRLDGATDGAGNPITIPVALQSDFDTAPFSDASPGPQGGLLSLRARSTTTTRGIPTGLPYDANLGTAGRIGCGLAAQQMVVPKQAPLEIVFPDDTLNQILHAAWFGGLLQFPVDPSLLGGVDLATYGITDLSLDLSSLLPPMATDCGPDGQLRLHVGDMKINARLTLFGTPLDAVVYVAFDAPITLAASGGQLGITVSAIENVQLEVNVVQPELAGFEDAISELLGSQLVPALGGLLGNGTPLASFPLPEIDISSQLGQPAGSLVIAIDVLSNPAFRNRIDGNTIVYGQLR